MNFGRQRKLDLTRMGCGKCKARLQQTKPVLKMKENKANPFGMFVKENFASIRRDNPGSSHKEIMNILSKGYREHIRQIHEIGNQKEKTIVGNSDEEVEDMVTSLGVLELN